MPVWLSPNSRGYCLRSSEPWECKSPHADHFGMPTGQAGRACLLNSACLVASGASPRHSASACSSKRAGGFITRIALDECLVPERYRTRAPICSALKALSAMPSLGKRISPVQLRVRDPFRNRASAQAGFISQLRRGQHSGLRPFRLHAAACGLLL